jgi:bifunctional ADP-heptose synthase (sugar kinase/adenylyltransferase)
MNQVPDTSATRILVVGDVMLDRYWFGDVLRISPEAPVPVVKVERSEERPGGAANVARNCAALGARVTLLSVVGADEAGRNLTKLMTDSGVECILHEDEKLSTTVKLRVVGRQQQLLRIDFENAPNHEVLQAKLADFEIRLAACDTGATLLTPNRSEMRQVVGRWQDDAELANKAAHLRSELKLDALLVTRSEEGMTLFAADGVAHEPAVAREVYDVSGAGDTVIATLAVMLGSGLALPQAMRQANLAAGVVVGKLGTATCSLEELENAVKSER